MAPRAAERALRVTVGELATRTHREVMEAGRQVVQRSSKRWRRVTDGAPCGFCAMLASRGPVYTSQDTADGGRYHGRCGCTAEPFEGDFADWQPSEAEQRYIDAYNASYEPGISPEKLTARMDAWLADPRNGALDLDDPAVWARLDDETLDALALRKMEEGDFLAAERIGEIQDGRFYDPTGRAIDTTNPFAPDVYDWFEKQDPATQARFSEKLEQRLGYDAGQMFAQESWAHTNTAKLGRTLPTEREMRKAYDDYLESEWLRAEAGTNGYMLTDAAKAQGVTVRRLWKVNVTTAQKWATREMLDYWNANGRLTYADFKAGYSGGAETTANRMKGAWV